MNQNRFISTAVLCLLLGITIPAFAQKGQEEKGGGGGKGQQAQHEQQPQHAQQAQQQPQRAQQAQHQQQPQHAQQAQHQQQPQRAQQAQHQQQPQRTQQAQRQQQPQRPQQAQHQQQPQRPQQAQHQQQPQRAQQAHQSSRQQAQPVASNRGGGQYGRISNANYSAHFGHGHSFHMMRPRMIGGYNRFQYGGYWFGYNQGWPVGWDYNDYCYVEYEGGAYYLYDLRHPGIHITLSIF